MSINSNDIADAGVFGRNMIRANTPEEARKLISWEPRRRFHGLEYLGWWLGGVVACAIVEALLALTYWSQTRTVTQTMEGGWKRTVIDYNVSYAQPFFLSLVATLVVWTISYVAYRLINND